jgi:chaperonin GroEL
MPKVYENGFELNNKILEGVKKLGDAVACTLGPKGKNVIIQAKGKPPIITKDGVTVASHIEYSDPFENAGAQVIKQASLTTAAEAGDGTTTSTILARAIVERARKYIVAGTSPVELKRGMDAAVEEIVKQLAGKAQEIVSLEQIENIARISANGDEKIAKLIATAVDKAGRDGAVTIEESRSLETKLEVVEGFQIDSGFISNAFITDESKGTLKYTDALVMVTDQSISTVDEMLPILEVVARENRPFIIVAESVEGQALSSLIVNATRGSMRVAAIKAPRYGEERRAILQDLALAVGATFISKQFGVSVQMAKREHLGKVKSVESFKGWTTFVGGNGDYKLVDQRITNLKEEILNTSDLRDAEVLQQRVSRLASGVAIIKVGGKTEVEMFERKHRIEDALEAVKSAQKEGVLAGGGTTLAKISNGLSLTLPNQDQQFGLEVIKQACLEPIYVLARNCGEKPDVIVDKILQLSGEQENMGYDFRGSRFVDMYEIGIIDPAKVTRCALQNAVSAASTLLTTEHAIIEV